ncbi:uncharacterized protein LOC131037524 [Cryptomeria japonica]|uniref:uncharacterized protein LOC131037524 n=1 Tax=Cryptomeria japonica TaxID=3369 RepID=UPI0027DAAC2C|nr:uncharacterized protein LOC131037524 [Cryptomeria japonica]
MLVNAMGDSDNIWQWCNARKKMCHQRSAAAAAVGYDAFSTKANPLKEQEEIKYQKKKTERQCLVDPVEQPTTPDPDDPVRKAGKLELSKLPSITSPCFSSSVCGQTSADSSSSASIVHDEAAEDGMHLQSTDFSSPSSCNNNNLILEQMGSLSNSPKIESLDLKKDQSLISRMPTRGFLRNLRPLGNRIAKLKASSEGLDLLVEAICLLESWGNKLIPVHRECKAGLAFADAGLHKKKVIRRAKSAYKQRCINGDAKQWHHQKILLEADSKPDLQRNNLSELGITSIVEYNQNQDDRHQAEAVQSRFMSRLRRSVRSSRGN